jgi:hypothetical protein
MTEVKFDLDEVTVKSGEALEVYFGKKSRYSLCFDATEKDNHTVILYDNNPGDGRYMSTLYTGSFKEFRQLLVKANSKDEESDQASGRTATAFS